jgi:hypothetical protein
MFTARAEYSVDEKTTDDTSIISPSLISPFVRIEQEEVCGITKSLLLADNNIFHHLIKVN